MDVFYIFSHSKHADEELRFSLRSVAEHLPWIRKVWIFGSRPEWISEDRTIIEHVSHNKVAWITGIKTPVKNMFHLLYLAALLPELTSEFLLFCDDYILLKPLDEEMARRQRTVQDLNLVKSRGTGRYKAALWRTFDQLKRMNYSGLNYEVHVPVHLKKDWILGAVQEFRDFMTEDRFYGMLSQISILNYAEKLTGFQPIMLREEGTYAGFHHKPFPHEEIVEKCTDRLFLNFDDHAYAPSMKQFLNELFPNHCMYEKAYKS